MTTTERENLATVEAYYQAVINRDLSLAGRYLDEDVEFISPLGHTFGRESVLKALQGFTSEMRGMQQRAAFEEGNRVMLVYDVQFDQPIGVLRTAVLLEVENGVIVRTELFHDAAPFKAAQPGAVSML